MATYYNTWKQIRQWMASELGDLVLATVKTDAGNSTTVAVLGSTTPPQYYNKPDDYFNDNYFESYCYEGTNIGESRLVSDWDVSELDLTVTPAATAAFDNTSKLELHHLFYSNEYLNAINMVIEGVARRYLFKQTDETSTTLTEGTTNDGDTLYTWEYNIPTSFLYLHQVTIEDCEEGKKLTGTVSGAFTLGETVTGGTSGATGILSYGPSGGTYILVREVSGTFTTGETATGGTSGKTCSSITAVDNETVGSGTFTYPLGHRDWRVIQTGTSPHTLQIDEDQVTFYGDLRLRWEGQASQDKVSADTDYIYIKPDWLVAAAISHLPHDRLIEEGLKSKLADCMRIAANPILTPVDPAGRAVIE